MFPISGYNCIQNVWEYIYCIHISIYIWVQNQFEYQVMKVNFPIWISQQTLMFQMDVCITNLVPKKKVPHGGYKQGMEWIFNLPHFVQHETVKWWQEITHFFQCSATQHETVKHQLETSHKIQYQYYTCANENGILKLGNDHHSSCLVYSKCLSIYIS